MKGEKVKKLYQILFSIVGILFIVVGSIKIIFDAEIFIGIAYLISACMLGWGAYKFFHITGKKKYEELQLDPSFTLGFILMIVGLNLSQNSFNYAILAWVMGLIIFFLGLNKLVKKGK